MKVTIVGAGIHGLTTAVQAARAGMDVVVLDQGPIPNPAASSHDYHRLIRHAYGSRHGYARLVVHAFAAWDRLWNVTGTSHFVETGTLAVGFKGSQWIRHSVSSLRDLGVEVTKLEHASLSERFPYVRLDAADEALYSPRGGILLADRILNDLVVEAGRLGVAFRPNTFVPDHHTFDSDWTVWCTGAWTAAADMRPSRQLVAYLESPPEWAHDACPMVLDLDERGGLYIVPGVQHTPWKIGMHRFSFSGSPNDSRAVQDHEIKALSDVYHGRITDATGPRISHGRACWYAVQNDSRFQLKAIPGGLRFYGGSGHSFKFGALIGEMLTSVMTGNMPLAEAQHVLAGREVAA